ncbi:MAG: MotA/TolQ/ExbB proton channel family protein [Planctomycetota bacterium]|nr:MotA/TolQ/ExbB proton channel family protein [Planctomycetota bacterium]
MSRSKSNSVINIIWNLGWPLLWGSVFSITFYELLEGPLDAESNPLLHRYFLGHPIAVATTIMFFVAISALIMRGLNLLGQQFVLSTLKLPEVDPQWKKEDRDKASELLEHTDSWSPRVTNSYLGLRLVSLLELIRSSGSAATLGDEMKYASERDADRQYEGSSLVRIIIWATPMLGFLGTVMGITQALGDLAGQQIGDDLNGAMQGLFSGLYVAFDTTAVALTLSIVLMFCQFMSDQFESELLGDVDQRVEDELRSRFSGSTAPERGLFPMDSLSAVMEELANTQSSQWAGAMATIQKQWQKWTAQQGESMGDAMSLALVSGMEKQTHLQQQQWQQWQELLRENAQLLGANQERMNQQSELLSRVVEATGEIASLEQVLNSNLTHLQETRQFEDAVISLSAAIQLLSTRLTGGSKTLDLQGGSPNREEAA